VFKLVPASLSSSDSHKLIQAWIHSTAGPYSTGYYASYFCVFFTEFDSFAGRLRNSVWR